MYIYKSRAKEMRQTHNYYRLTFLRLAVGAAAVAAARFRDTVGAAPRCNKNLRPRGNWSRSMEKLSLRSTSQNVMVA